MEAPRNDPAVRSRPWPRWPHWPRSLSLAPLRIAAQSAEKGNAKGKDLGGPGGVIAVNGVRDENLPPPPAGPTPREADGKPNLSGVWLSGNYSFANMGGPLPLQPWAQKLMQDRQAAQDREDPEAKCLPAGVPRITPVSLQDRPVSRGDRDAV